ncbi:hypothetical protein Lesp02_38110 [Lentzea sp. NBRC 105346]|uniref:hypothetical protein n=1 Tax=Lentzea sp. NBRC 105346 TaxID=3032205 RepID=UPI0024A4016F|nr:hypothetical protein [Lentzea sp. NBRC 105346]GLZ31623.1 hypothetical protein Lesp02_38110 [Lentzea sp. NBRC 105346]
MRIVPIDFRPVAPHTAAVYRVVDGEQSWFVKILQSPEHWSMLMGMPSDIVERLVAEFPWRAEADFLLSGFELPPGMRRPRVHRIDELGPGRVAMWLEYVECADVGWDLPRFTRAARLLGRWAGRRFGGEPGGALRFLVDGLIANHEFDHPGLSDIVERIPELLDRLDALPQACGHSDACPQNLLVPKEDPDTFVVIDVTWQVPAAVGFDLGQLLIGLAHDGTLPVADLPPIREAIIDAYVCGLAEEGRRVAREDVAFGCDVSMLIRSGFHSGPELTDYVLGLVPVLGD